MTDYEFIQMLSDNSRSHSEHERAFSDFYHRNRSRFIGYIRGQKMKYDDETICDWYQDSCVILYDAIRCGKLVDADEDIQLISYLFSVGYRKYADRCRKGIYHKKYKEEKTEDIFSGSVNGRRISKDKDKFDNLVEKSEKFDLIYKVITAMSEPCNSILLLSFWEDKPIDDVAEICGYQNAGAAKMQKSRCMSKLKIRIKQLWER